ncbi:MAG: hypothetical protein CL840_03375 [Crocinitomicaceae bacterium]|jgi:hypothetical protein|nr:hypothetical protein [Crocinitomicaceae bacterium]|tara:strand:- start:335759 stop:336337 length:579 start_codon:yes stop_codon:yes gene_type:complete
MKSIKTLLIASTAIALTACNSTAPVQQSNLPEWVMMPKVENGITATECVASSNSFGIDRNMATANARVAIARQIQLKVSALDKTYRDRVDADADKKTGATFSSVSRQLTDMSLTGSQMVRSDIITIEGTPHMCVQVTLNPNKTDALLDKIIAESGRKVSANEDAVLREEFKAYKAQEELDRALYGERLTTGD